MPKNSVPPQEIFQTSPQDSPMRLSQVYKHARTIQEFLSNLEIIQHSEISHEQDHIEFLEKTLKSLKSNARLMRNLRKDRIVSDSRSITKSPINKINIDGSYRKRLRSFSPPLSDLNLSRGNDIYSMMSYQPQSIKQKSKEQPMAGDPTKQNQQKRKLKTKSISGTRKASYLLKNHFSLNQRKTQKTNENSIDTFGDASPSVSLNSKPIAKRNPKLFTLKSSFRRAKNAIDQMSPKVINKGAKYKNVYTPKNKFYQKKKKDTAYTSYINPYSKGAIGTSRYKYLWDADSDSEDEEKKLKARQVAELNFNQGRFEISQSRAIESPKTTNEISPTSMIYKSLVINNTGGNLTGFGSGLGSDIEVTEQKKLSGKKKQLKDFFSGNIQYRQGAFKKQKNQTMPFKSRANQSSTEQPNQMSPTYSHSKIIFKDNIKADRKARKQKTENTRTYFSKKKASSNSKAMNASRSEQNLFKKHDLPQKAVPDQKASPHFKIQLPVKQFEDMGTMKGATSKENTSRYGKGLDKQGQMIIINELVFDKDNKNSYKYSTSKTLTPSNLQASNDIIKAKELFLAKSFDINIESPQAESKKKAGKGIKFRPRTQRLPSKTKDQFSHIFNKLKKVKQSGQGGVGLLRGAIGRNKVLFQKSTRLDSKNEKNMNNPHNLIPSIKEPSVKDFRISNAADEAMQYLDFNISQGNNY